MSSQKLTMEMNHALDLMVEGFQMRFDLWKYEVLFSWRWWFGLTLFFLMWGIWIAFRKRESTHRLLYAGMFVMLVSIGFDYWLEPKSMELSLSCFTICSNIYTI